jgi:hypothetical protein
VIEKKGVSLRILINLHILSNPEYEKLFSGMPSVSLFFGFLPWWHLNGWICSSLVSAGEYEHSRSKNKGPSNGPQRKYKHL